MSQLIGLVEFRTGDDIRRFTTLADDYVWDGHIWYAAPTKHSNIKRTADLPKNGIHFDFPIDNEFARTYLGYGPDDETTVKLRRNLSSAPATFRVFWTGRVADCEATEDEITLICESLATVSKSNGLGPRMQKFCRHVVYNFGCNLDKEDFAVPTTVTAIDARFLTLTCPGAAAHPNGYFNGGFIATPNGSLRYVTNHIGNQLTLWRPAPEIAAAIALGTVNTDLFPGCDGARMTCHDKFNNLPNNGAFYWIPDRAPDNGSPVL